jgi:signal transduction histidine kinase
MPEEYQIIIGIIIAIVIFIAIGFCIIMLIAHINQRKKKFIQEKQILEATYTEQLLQSQLEMQEQTFNTISREIHDNVGQVLSLAKVQLNIIDQSDTYDKTLLADAKDSVSKAMTDLRDIAKSLNSERIQLSSLPEITAHELSRISRAKLMVTSIKTEGDVINITEQKKLIIFRIMQEAFNNIIKHSGAKNMEVCFCYETDHLIITIADNGTGFDKGLITKKDGLGLQNITSRAALIGGEATISSIINEGTTITIKTPYA